MLVTYRLTPADAAEDAAEAIFAHVPTWYEPKSGVLWMEGMQQRWTGNAWETNRDEDHVTWSSPDGCRLYVSTEQGGVKMVTRTLTP